jgi:two-component system, OmpR family, response regulator
LEAELRLQDRAILLLENDSEIAAEIKHELERNGYHVQVAFDLPSADWLRAGTWSLIIVDRPPNGSEALSALELWRKEEIKLPVMMISSLSSAEEVARGLKSGADDYLAKPFQFVELVARVEALLRRFSNIQITKLSFDDLVVDLIDRTVIRGGRKLNLLPREFMLLAYFVSRAGQVITRDMLLNDIWRRKSFVESNVVDASITNLRRKIDDPGKPSRIANIRGVGFFLRKIG